MTKSYSIIGLDCANCSTKIERKITGLSGVHDVRVNFLTQKLTLEADEVKMRALAQQAARIVREVEIGARLLLPKV